MGREVRRVPADWQHPKHNVREWSTGRMVEQYKPLLPGERYQPEVDEWTRNAPSGKLAGDPTTAQTQRIAP